MHKTRCVVELEGEAISPLFEVLVEGLSILSEKGFESIEEKAECQRIVGVVGEIREAMKETTILSPSHIRTLERLRKRLKS